jgi:hypothetical protein
MVGCKLPPPVKSALLNRFDNKQYNLLSLVVEYKNGNIYELIPKCSDKVYPISRIDFSSSNTNNW